MRFNHLLLLWIVLGLAWCSPSLAAPAIDGTPATAATGSGVTSYTITLSTSSTNDVIDVMAGNENATGGVGGGILRTVTSVTATGLTFTKRGSVSNTGSGAVYPVDLEEWTAPSTGVLTNKVITVNLSGVVDAAMGIAFGVSGASSISSPFDSDVSLPASSSTATNSPALVAPTYSTSQAHDLVYSFTAVNQPLSSTSSTWTLVAAVNGAAGNIDYNYEKGFSHNFTTTQSSVTPDMTAGSGGATYVFLVDAITGDALVTSPTNNLPLFGVGP